MLVRGMEPKAKALVNHEDGGLGNAAFFPGIENPPGCDHLPLRVGENDKGNSQIGFDYRGLFWRIHRNCGNGGSSPLKWVKAVPILRQLAEAEGSPVAAIKHQNGEARLRQLGKVAQAPVGIRQLEIRDGPAPSERKPRRPGGF